MASFVSFVTAEAGGFQPPKAVIFDLDSALIDSRAAWRYAVEEAIAATCGRRIDVRPLVHEYHRRPWSQALTVLLPDRAERERCEPVCIEISRRSGLKKLLVHEGIGMALDSLLARSIEIGAISRQPHSLALKQAQSTGLDRFFAVMAATPVNEPYDPAARLGQCTAFLERGPTDCAFISADPEERRCGAAAGFRVLFPAWVAEPPPGVHTIGSPNQILAALLNRETPQAT